MNKLKKQILGMVGLAIVAAVTMVAYTIPASGVGATEVTETIIVHVASQYATITPTNIKDGDIIYDDSFAVSYDHESAMYACFSLSYNGTIIGNWTEVYSDFVPAECGKYPEGEGYTDPTSGSASLPAFDLGSNYGEYVLSWRAYSNLPALSQDDSLSFYHQAAAVRYVGTTDENEPIFDVFFNDIVDSINIDILNEEEDKSIFDKIIVYPKDSGSRYELIEGPTHINGTTNTNRARIVIAMPDKSKTGEYTVSSLAFDAAGNQLGQEVREKFDWTEDIEVPNTGRFFIGGNIASSDYLITGLIIFFSASILALVILNKKKTPSRRR